MSNRDSSDSHIVTIVESVMVVAIKSPKVVTGSSSSGDGDDD